MYWISALREAGRLGPLRTPKPALIGSAGSNIHFEIPMKSWNAGLPGVIGGFCAAKVARNWFAAAAKAGDVSRIVGRSDPGTLRTTFCISGATCVYSDPRMEPR